MKYRKHFNGCTENCIQHDTQSRIDANDDYNTNGGVSACQAKIAVEVYNEYPTLGMGNSDVAIYNPGVPLGPGVPTTPWIDVNPLEYPVGSGFYPFTGGGYSSYMHYAPAIAYGQGGGAEYMVTECINDAGFGDFFMMSPVGAACGAGLSGTNFYETNTTYPATSSGHANAVSTPCNNPNDTSLTTWTHNTRIYYKRSGYSYAYKQSPNTSGIKATTQISIWPNPAEDYITVNDPDNTANAYTIKNVLGQTIASGSIGTGANVIQMNHFAAGSYFINFNKNGVRIGNRRFVKI